MHKLRAWFRLTCALTVTIIGAIHTDIGARLRPEAKRLTYRMVRQGEAARLVCRLFNIHVKISEDVRSSPGTLRVSNHLTVMDPIFLASQLDVCFAGKAEIGRWPIIGWICRSYAMLLVDRRRLGSARSFASQIKERLLRQGSVLVFPEGTTGNGTTLLPFKTGAFESIRDGDHGQLQAIFMDVIGVNGKAVPGMGGRMAIAQNAIGKPPSFLGHIYHLAGFRRLDIELRVSPILKTSGMDRREISAAARDAILALDRNKFHGTE